MSILEYSKVTSYLNEPHESVASGEGFWRLFLEEFH